MKRITNVVLQVTGIAAQFLTLFGGVIPQKYHLGVSVGIAATQAAAGVIASAYNPDGTPATSPYRPK